MALHRAIIALTAVALSTGIAAQSPHAGAALTGVSFLVGDWQAGRGQVSDTGGAATGHSVITLEAGGDVLLRKDHTDLIDKAGNAAGSFEQVMIVYPEAGTLHADYSDGQHVIHYTNAMVVPGQSVTFTSAAQANAPTFQLQYRLIAPRTLSVNFSMAPPGGSSFHPIATGTLTKGG